MPRKHAVEASTGRSPTMKLGNYVRVSIFFVRKINPARVDLDIFITHQLHGTSGVTSLKQGFYVATVPAETMAPSLDCSESTLGFH